MPRRKNLFWCSDLSLNPPVTLWLCRALNEEWRMVRIYLWREGYSPRNRRMLAKVADGLSTMSS